MSEGKIFKILTIDGGGIRGIFSAHILKRIQDEIGVIYDEDFEIIAGTSTGAITAASLSVGHPIGDVIKLYKTEGKKIFKKNYSSFLNLLNWKNFVNSKYDNSYLKKVLEGEFGDLTLSDTKTRLLIPASDISNGNVFVFKSNYDPSFVRDKDVKISTAVLSSCAAPSYFKPNKVQEYLLADGGLWSNNPSLVGLTEAMGRRFNVDKDSIRILSIGTGIGKKYYNVTDHEGRWGLKHWGTELVDTIMNLQSINVDNIVRFILSDKYLRINFETDKGLALDDVGEIDNLISKADEVFTYNFEKIKTFLTRRQ